MPGESSVIKAKEGASQRGSSQYRQPLQRSGRTQHESYMAGIWECVLLWGKTAYDLENFPKPSPHPNGNNPLSGLEGHRKYFHFGQTQAMQKLKVTLQSEHLQPSCGSLIGTDS